MPLSGKSESGPNTASMVTTLLLFFCIITVAFFTYIKSVEDDAGTKSILDLFRASEAGVVKEAKILSAFEFDARENPTFVVYKDQIVKCSKNGIWFMDKQGEIVRSEGVTYNNPIVKTNGSLLLVADRGAGDICVIDDKAVRWSEKIGASILNADISGGGYVTVVTPAKRDNNEVRVFEPHGIELFRKVIANDHAVSACVSPSGGTLVLSGISAGAAGAFSRYKFYDMKGNLLAEFSFDASAELLPLFWFGGAGSLFAAGDRAIAAVGMDGKAVFEKKFRRVAGAGLADKGKIAVAADDGEGAGLKIYSSDGNELASCELHGKPKGLKALKGVISVNTSDTVYFFNTKCVNISKYRSDSVIRQVVLLNNRQAAVITERDATVIDIR